MGLMLSIHWLELLAFIYLAQGFIIANRGSNIARNLTRHLHPPLISLYESSFDKERKSSIGVDQGQLKGE